MWKHKRNIRRGIILSLAAFLILSLARVAFTDGPIRMSVNSELETATSINAYSASSGNPSLSVSSSTTGLTVATDRILGYVVVRQDNTQLSELTLGLYDCTTTQTLIATNMFDEAEWDDDGTNVPRWYPYPKRLTNGLGLIQGANTVAIIYYEDMTKF